MESFSYAVFERLLADFRDAGYRVLDFPAAFRAASSPAGAPILLLRHDIDFDLEKALEMARLEHGLGLRATYFVLLRTGFYNVFSADSTRRIRDVLALGHTLGLHFDHGQYAASANESETAEACRREAGMLSDWFETPIEIVSYHRPQPREIEGRPEGSRPLLNTYMKEVTRSIEYRSDSRGTWRYGHPVESDSFRSRQSMQLLIHPIWWARSPRAPLEVLQDLVRERGDGLEREIARHCTIFRVGRWQGVTDS